MATEMKKQDKKVKPKKIAINHCRHELSGNVDYSLGINFEDCHATMDAASWDHKPGHYAEFTLFDLQPSDIKALGEAIIAEAIKIEMGAK